MTPTSTRPKSTLSVELNELLKSAEHFMTIKKGTFLFQEGMTAKELYIVRSGRVKINKLSSDGRELSLRICTKDEIVGELTLFSEDAKYLFNAVVVESGVVAVINKEELERKLFENSKLALEFMKWMSDHFRKTQTKFRDLVLYGKKGALYSTLVRMTNSYGRKTEDGILIDLPLTNQELANFCATTRESVNRMLNDLRAKGILSISKSKITIHDLNYIRSEINCEGCSAVFCSIE